MLHENISRAVLSPGGLTVFSFIASMPYGHWRQLCAVDVIAVTEQREQARIALEPVAGTKPVP